MIRLRQRLRRDRQLRGPAYAHLQIRHSERRIYHSERSRGIYSNTPAQGFRISMMINRLFFFLPLFLMKKELPPL